VPVEARMDYLIRQMGYVVVATPAMEAAAADLGALVGAACTGRRDGLVLMSSSARACEVAYVHAATTGIRAVGLEAADAAAVAEVERRLRRENIDILSDRPSIPGIERAVRFRTPFGPIFEVHTPAARDARPQHLRAAARAGRLDHVNIRAHDPRGLHDLLTGLLGMTLSDRTEDYSRAWYRAADGFHHTVAAGVGSGFHHYGFAAHSVQDLVGIADGLAERGRTLLWGVGRHGPGNNIFSYYRDPAGCVVEVSFGMEHIPAAAVRPAGVWSADYDEQVLDLWGSKVPAAYAAALTPFVA
jgi:hypothetical protein